MFQSISDKKARRPLGEHYTSKENILKVIKPLFLDALYDEFNSVKFNASALNAFHEKIAGLNFLDPACGCGNFLIVAYSELRKLELKVIDAKLEGEAPNASFFKIRLSQFHGIEVNGFPCEIAKAGMWMTQHQMNREAERKLHAIGLRTIFPLSDSADIICANALQLDWLNAIQGGKIDYILGNPPFIGYSFQSKEQKADMLKIFSGNKKAGKMDYVCAWYQKAAKIMQGDHHIKTAFVSTNSITQGDQVAFLWKGLFELGIHIDFAYRTFKWNNDATGMAAVHCVIIGLSCGNAGKYNIFKEEQVIEAHNINAYLLDAPNVCIESRNKPLFNQPEIIIGNRPCDGGHLIIEANEYEEFIKNEPNAKPYIKRFMGAEEYINNKPRYCLWFVDVEADKFKKMSFVMDRIKKVREMRLKSSKIATQNAARFPAVFQELHQPTSSYILIPRTSSENRQYIPIGFLDKDIIVSDAALTIPDATLYHFAILTSSVHMAWMRAVAGRLEMSYRYSKDIVYNNFPWIKDVNEEQKAQLESLAQAVLDARAAHEGATLADLYDPLTMPIDLLKAHQKLDKAVLKLYGFEKNARAGRANDYTESQIVAALMEMYSQLLTVGRN